MCCWQLTTQTPDSMCLPCRCWEPAGEWVADARTTNKRAQGSRPCTLLRLRHGSRLEAWHVVDTGCEKALNRLGMADSTCAGHQTCITNPIWRLCRLVSWPPLKVISPDRFMALHVKQAGLSAACRMLNSAKVMQGMWGQAKHAVSQGTAGSVNRHRLHPAHMSWPHHISARPATHAPLASTACSNYSMQHVSLGDHQQHRGHQHCDLARWSASAAYTSHRALTSEHVSQ